MSDKNRLIRNWLIFAVISAVMIFFGVNYLLDSRKVTLIPTGNPDNVRLATNVSNIGMVAVLDKYAKPDDVIEVRAGDLDKLKSIHNGLPLLIYGKNDDQSNVYSLVKKHGIKMIGYNLEDVHMTLDELIEKEKAAYTLAKENDLFFVFAPLAIHAEKYGADFAKNADAIAIQLRNYQLEEDFTDKVINISSDIRRSSPDIEVWVQLDVNPRIQRNQNMHQSLSSQEIVDQINQIKDHVDLVSIFYPRNDASVAEKVFVELRK